MKEELKAKVALASGRPNWRLVRRITNMKALLCTLCLWISTSLIDSQAQTLSPTPPTLSTPQITSGKVENGRYTNSFFRFSLAIPAGWKMMSDEEYAERQRLVHKFANQQKPGIKQDLMAGLNAVPTLLRLSPKNELKGEARTFTILAQNLAGHAPISPEEYLNQSKQEYSQFQGVGGGFGPFYHIQSAGADLTACDLTMQGKSFNGYMTFAVTSRQGYLLSFVLAARSSDAQRKVKEILNTLKFE